MDRKIILIAHNIRSCHNVGSLFRTADGLGVGLICLTGYTPYPAMVKDDRLPHLASKIHRQIAKTSLGAEMSVKWLHAPELEPVIDKIQSAGYEVLALEQSPKSINLRDYGPGEKVALVIGNEVDGLSADDLALADRIVEIPMLGKKESLNVASAAAIALYHLRHFD